MVPQSSWVGVPFAALLQCGGCRCGRRIRRRSQSGNALDPACTSSRCRPSAGGSDFSDLARAHVAGLQVLMEGRVQSQALNLGTGGGYSVREVIESVRRITGRAFAVRETARRPGDPPHLVASVNRAKELLGWTAVESDLDRIVASAWKWLQR